MAWTNYHLKNPQNQIKGAKAHAQGKHFEDYISASLRFYERIGQAVIEKTPEPMRPTKNLGNGKFIAYYEKAAQPDYKGVIKGGKAVIFEAKFTSSDRIEQTRVTVDQSTRLDDYEKLGAICFVLAGFGSGEVFRIPWSVWKSMKDIFGRKYVKPEELDIYKVKLGRDGQLLLLD